MRPQVGGLWGFLLSLAILLPACVSTAPTPKITLDAVGPKAGGLDFGREGFLMVYTATEERNDSGIWYHPHTGYQIFSPEGALVRRVANRVGSTDEVPMMAILKGGRYTVIASAEGYGRISIPVVISGGKMTSVYLERAGMPEANDAPAAQLVCLPNGRAVGWRAKDQSANLPAKQ